MAYIGVSPSNGVRRVHTYTATASQTTFSGAGAEGTSLSYKDSNFVDVYQNGVKLGDADYTATSGTSIVLGTGATASDLVVIVVFDVFSVADTVSKADGGTFDNAVTITTADNNAQLTLVSTDADASVGPQLDLYRNSASPADSDVFGRVRFLGENDADEQIAYATIFAKAVDVSDGTEDANLRIDSIVGGTNSQRLEFNATEAVFNEGGADLDFRVESNGNANMLLVDGGNDAVVVGQSAPDTTVIGTTPPFQVIGSGGNSFITVTNRQASDSGPHIALTKSRNTSVGSHTIVQSGDTVGAIVFQADDGTNLDSRAAEIRCKIDGTPGENDVPGRLEFLTTADGANSPTERMRINDSGDVMIGTTTVDLSAVSSGNGTTITNSGQLIMAHEGNNMAFMNLTDYDSGTENFFVFLSDASTKGSIGFNGSNTVYATSSDYRLKENINYSFDASSQVKKLKPCEFNFKTNSDVKVTGFIAHEAQEVCPLAVTGVKDETEKYTDENGDEKTRDVIQGIDTSLLVPLLTKSLQEALTRIDTLEAEVKALKGE